MPGLAVPLALAPDSSVYDFVSILANMSVSPGLPQGRHCGRRHALHASRRAGFCMEGAESAFAVRQQGIVLFHRAPVSRPARQFAGIADEGFARRQGLQLQTPADMRADIHHGAYCGCPIRYGARDDRMVLNAAHLDLPFPDANREMLELVTPALAVAMQQLEDQASLVEQVKHCLKRAMSRGAPDIALVARELGLSQRTLQRRITAEGQTFRVLLAEARHEMSLQLLSDPAIDIKEIAYLPGYDDTNSFYRAFRQWEGVTPNHWRRDASQAGAGR